MYFKGSLKRAACIFLSLSFQENQDTGECFFYGNKWSKNDWKTLESNYIFHEI